jgi:hypothetical protein
MQREYKTLVHSLRLVSFYRCRTSAHKYFKEPGNELGDSIETSLFVGQLPVMV